MTANEAVYPIQTMCRAFGVSRAGFYAWRDREPSQRARSDANLAARIRTIPKASRESYGAPHPSRAQRRSRCSEPQAHRTADEGRG